MFQSLRALTQRAHRQAVGRAPRGGPPKPTTAVLLLATVTLGVGCTTPAPWGIEGQIGETCYPDNSCNPGLTCVAAICQPSSQETESDTWGKKDGSPNPPAVHDCDDGPAAPTFRNTPSTTTHSKIALHGTADDRTVALLIDRDGNVSRKPVTATFCVEAQLGAREGQQTLDVRAVDAHGCRSEPTTVTVRRSGATERENLLRGATMHTEQYAHSGSFSALTDDDVESSLRLSFTDRGASEACDDYTYLWIQLPRPKTMSQLRIRYPRSVASSKAFAKCWGLYGAENSHGFAPNPSSRLWKRLIESKTSTASGLNAIFEPTTVREIGILFFQDGSTSPRESIALGEIAAYKETEKPYVGCQLARDPPSEN